MQRVTVTQNQTAMSRSKTLVFRASGQDGGALCLLAQPKGQQQFKNKKQPELTENQTVWKSNTPGDKEQTFIQTGRRGGDGQLGWRGLMARQQLADPERWRIVAQTGQAVRPLADPMARIHA